MAAPRGRFERHPLVRNMPTLPMDSADYGRIRASVASEGIREPLKCVREGEKLLVLDGLHRMRIAEELQIAELPYQLVEAGDLVSFVCASVVRAGWNKSALAYRMWPFFADVACSHGGKRGKGAKGNDFPLATSAEIAVRIGVSEKLVDQAKGAHAYFAKYPERRAELEPLILVSLLPLHRVRETETVKARTDAGALRSISLVMNRLAKPFCDWEQMEALERERASNLVAETLRKLPKEVQMAALETLEVAWRP